MWCTEDVNVKEESLAKEEETKDISVSTSEGEEKKDLKAEEVCMRGSQQALIILVIFVRKIFIYQTMLLLLLLLQEQTENPLSNEDVKAN